MAATVWGGESMLLHSGQLGHKHPAMNIDERVSGPNIKTQLYQELITAAEPPISHIIFAFRGTIVAQKNK